MLTNSYCQFSSNLEIKEGLKPCKMLNISTNVINSKIKNIVTFKQSSFNSKQFLRNKHICVNSIIRNSLKFNFYDKNLGPCYAGNNSAYFFCSRVDSVRSIHNSSISKYKSNTSVFNHSKEIKAANGFYNFDNNKSKISSTSLDYKNKNLKLNSRPPVYRDIGKTK